MSSNERLDFDNPSHVAQDFSAEFSLVGGRAVVRHEVLLAAFKALVATATAYRIVHVVGTRCSHYSLLNLLY